MKLFSEERIIEAPAHMELGCEAKETNHILQSNFDYDGRIELTMSSLSFVGKLRETGLSECVSGL